MKGRVYLSDEYSEGSRFIVELSGGTLSPSENREVASSKDGNFVVHHLRQPSELLPDRLSVLLVDDSTAACKLLVRRLKSLRCNVSTFVASTGEEALRLCEEKAFDLILLDENMQPAGGILLGHEVVRELRVRLGMDRTVIIGCTGNEATCRGDFMLSGADEVWSKPTPPTDEMIQCIMKARRKRIGDDAAALPCSVKVAVVDDSISANKLLIRRLSMYVHIVAKSHIVLTP